MNQEASMKNLKEQIVKNYQEIPGLSKINSQNQISQTEVKDIIGKLQKLIFAGFFDSECLREDCIHAYAESLLLDVKKQLEEQLSRALPYRDSTTSPDSGKAGKITLSFLEKIPAIRALLATDVDAAFNGDPAAFNKEEIILSYPGLYAIMVNRLAHELYLLNIPLIPRMMTEHAHSLTGIDIHPGASIGHHFFIDHGTGIVIGETTTIGNHVKMYQSVTLGGLSTRGGQKLRNTKRHPTIEDRVTIYSGASIFGGETVIGADVVIGASAFIVKSVPKNTRVSVHNPELLIKGIGQVKEELEQGDNWDK